MARQYHLRGKPVRKVFIELRSSGDLNPLKVVHARQGVLHGRECAAIAQECKVRPQGTPQKPNPTNGHHISLQKTHLATMRFLSQRIQQPDPVLPIELMVTRDIENGLVGECLPGPANTPGAFVYVTSQDDHVGIAVCDARR